MTHFSFHMSSVLVVSALFTGHALLHPRPQIERKAAVASAEEMEDETRWDGWVLSALRAARNISDARAEMLTSTEPDYPTIIVPKVGSWPRFQPRTATCPSLFVAVMSRRDGSATRSKIRQMWKAAHERWGKLEAKFAICQHADQDEQEDVAARVAEEDRQHRDLMLLDCTEGYGDGRLTAKVKLAMQGFLQHEGFDLFMKTDDDTFISPARLCRFMSAQPARSHDFANSYIGVFAEYPQETGHGDAVCRDPTSAWYEPASHYQQDRWPPTAKGGTGYILSKATVQTLFSRGIPDHRTVNSEDRAVAVWVDDLKKAGYATDILNLPGTDGYLRYHPFIRMSGRYSVFPYVLHHHLDGDEIACLYEIDQRQDPTALVDGCFSHRHSTNLYIDGDNGLKSMRSSHRYRSIARTADGFKNAEYFNESSDEYVLACMGAH